MSSKPPVLVSRCLLGIPCRYDGKSVPAEAVCALEKYATLVAVCPESDGGMPTPRIPSERQGDKVVNKAGEDTTAFFRRGAEMAREIAHAKQIPFAILKEKSPSCGTHQIYDGSFTGRKVNGMGVAAELLTEAGLTVYSEEDLEGGLPQPLRVYLGIEEA